MPIYKLGFFLFVCRVESRDTFLVSAAHPSFRVLYGSVEPLMAGIGIEAY